MCKNIFLFVNTIGSNQEETENNGFPLDNTMNCFLRTFQTEETFPESNAGTFLESNAPDNER